MKKIIVSLFALVAIAPAVADGSCGCKSKNCDKSKKVRVVYVGAQGDAAKNDASLPVVAAVGGAVSGPTVGLTLPGSGAIGRTGVSGNRPVSRAATVAPSTDFIPTREHDSSVRYVGPSEPAYDPVYDSVYEPVPQVYTDTPQSAREHGRAKRVNSDFTNWYFGGRIGLDLLSWKNKYAATPAGAIDDPSFDHDDYVFEPVFGGDVFLGYHFNPAVRGDLELGYMSEFEDADNGIAFRMSTFYATFNAYYDFLNDFYVGAGLGFAFPRIELDWEWFVPGSQSETNLSVMAALMGGYTYKLSDDVVLDLRYRLSGHWGPTLSRGVMNYPSPTGIDLTGLEAKVGFVLDNQISVGLRYEF